MKTLELTSEQLEILTRGFEKFKSEIWLDVNGMTEFPDIRTPQHEKEEFLDKCNDIFELLKK